MYRVFILIANYSNHGSYQSIGSNTTINSHSSKIYVDGAFEMNELYTDSFAGNNDNYNWSLLEVVLELKRIGAQLMISSVALSKGYRGY